MKFKTNINCSGCVAQVKPYLESVEGIKHWEVDTQKPDKILSVSGDVESDTIEQAVADAGFQIEPVKPNWLKRLFG